MGIPVREAHWLSAYADDDSLAAVNSLTSQTVVIDGDWVMQQWIDYHL